MKKKDSYSILKSRQCEYPNIIFEQIETKFITHIPHLGSLMCFCPSKKQIHKRCNLCINPGWQNPIQVCPRVLFSLYKSKSRKDVICVKIPDGRT